MEIDIPSIRSRHATAIANRERGTFDSRDDDIGVLIGEIERLTALCREACESDLAYLTADGDGCRLLDSVNRRDAAMLAVFREGGMK